MIEYPPLLLKPLNMSKKGKKRSSWSMKNEEIRAGSAIKNPG
jgi:hypothetical protein